MRGVTRGGPLKVRSDGEPILMGLIPRVQLNLPNDPDTGTTQRRQQQQQYQAKRQRQGRQHNLPCRGRQHNLTQNEHV